MQIIYILAWKWVLSKRQGWKIHIPPHRPLCNMGGEFCSVHNGWSCYLMTLHDLAYILLVVYNVWMWYYWHVGIFHDIAVRLIAWILQLFNFCCFFLCILVMPVCHECLSRKYEIITKNHFEIGMWFSFILECWCQNILCCKITNCQGRCHKLPSCVLFFPLHCVLCFVSVSALPQ